MHQYDQFKQDMEKLHKADLQNPIRPKKGKSEKSYFDLTELNRPIQTKPNSDNTVPNLFRFDSQQTIPNCTVITFDGLDGFMWIGPDGVRHNEGLRWPTMRIEQNCTVEVLTDEYGRESKGWYKDGQQDPV